MWDDIKQVRSDRNTEKAKNYIENYRLVIYDKVSIVWSLNCDGFIEKMVK